MSSSDSVTPRKSISRAFHSILFTAVFLLAPLAGRASFHLMQIDELLGGVDGDTTAQAIELRMRSAGQNFLFSDAGGTNGPAKLVAFDANGANPITLISFSHDVTAGIAGDTVLITSPHFANYTSTPITPDFSFTNLIPSAYLAAGQIDYESGSGGILWSVSFGGANFKGAVPGATFNGSFGTPYGSPLPSSTLNALAFGGVATAASSNNSTDCALTGGPASFTNNAGQSASLVPEPDAMSLVLCAFPLAAGFARRKRFQSRPLN